MQGQALGLTNSLSDADNMGVMSYRWESSTDGTNWSLVGNNVTLDITAELVGKQLRVTASYTDGHGTPESVSSATTAVAAADFTGNSANDVLTGSAGNDILNGGAGADTLVGGAGDDVYYVDNLSDKVVETTTVGGASDAGGIDKVFSALLAYSLPTFVEIGAITSSGTAKITGNVLDNTLYAGIGNNVISGGLGTDTADYSYGQTGTTGVNVSLATANVQATGGSGSDALIGIENLTGSNYNDVLIGNSDINVLSGSSGNDTLDGGLGADTLIGGLGQTCLSSLRRLAQPISIPLPTFSQAIRSS